MGVKLLYFISVIVAVSAQSYRVCIPTSQPVLCQSLDKDGSRAVCVPVESKIDCALKILSRDADFGVFSEEEMVLLAQMQISPLQPMTVIGSIRDVTRNDPYAFESVAVVPSSHTGGLEGLRGGSYCHPGLDEPDLRWSPRVLKTLEKESARTDQCPDANTDGKTAEEMEVETLSKFFGSACRPGPWSANSSVDLDLKSRYQSLCSLCGDGSGCARYTIDMGASIVGVRNDNRHIQALECLRRAKGTSVAYVAWQHVREFFTIRNPQDATSYSLLCPDGSLSVLTNEALTQSTAACSFVKQPWKAIVTNNAENAIVLLRELKSWWPNGASPNGNSWQAVLFGAIVGGSNARVNFEDLMPSPVTYVNDVRNVTSIKAHGSCIPARRWCTISESEQAKCLWLQISAQTLGIEPGLICQQRLSIFECFSDIKNNNADVIAAPANYGYLARQHYGLSPVKLVQNSRNDPRAFSRVVALLRESSTQSVITRFENLRDKKACFPEFGGISYLAFVRAAQENEVISRSECDYARAVSEFFSGACAPGALNATHALSEYNAENLCSLCKPANTTDGTGNGICTYDSSNKYYGNAGAVACLADPESDVAFVELENIKDNLKAAGLAESQVRVLCRNNRLAAASGVDVEPSCLLADVVDSEVLSRRSDPLVNSLNALLDSLDLHFGYNAVTATQLINFAIFSPLNGLNDLLFKNTAVGLSEPSSDTANEAARNYKDLFRHLDSCTSAAPHSIGLASRSFYSYLTIVIGAVMARYVVY